MFLYNLHNYGLGFDCFLVWGFLVCLFFKETPSSLMPCNLLKILNPNVPVMQQNTMQNHHISV